MSAIHPSGVGEEPEFLLRVVGICLRIPLDGRANLVIIGRKCLACAIHIADRILHTHCVCVHISNIIAVVCIALEHT